MKTKQDFWKLLQLTWPLRGWVVLSVALGFLTIASSVGLMATSAYLISAAALHPSVAALSVAVVGVRFFGLARGGFRYLERYVSHEITFRLLGRLRVWFYQTIEPLAPARLIEKNWHSGDLLTRVVGDIETLQNFYSRVLAPPLVAAVCGVALWLFFGAFDPVLALIFLTFYLLVGLGLPLVAGLTGRSLGQELISLRAAYNTRLIDHLQGLADLLAFGQADSHAAKLNALDARLTRLQQRQAQLAALQNALGSWLMNLAAIVMLVKAIGLVAEGRLDPLFLAVLTLATLAGFEAVLPLPSTWGQLPGNLAAARRLFELTEASPAVVFEAQQTLPIADNSLVIRNLTFRYSPQNSPVLQNFNLRLIPNQITALIGPSGAGKTTLLNLLMRFWDYQQGEIKLGGQELRDFSEEQLRRLFAVVSQDTYLFNTTLGENIRLARPAATLAEVEHAAQLAQLTNFVATLPQGYNTPVGEGGLRLSGGERQRIAIARAILQAAPFLILDEPTANLDSVTEQAIWQTLATLGQGRTILLITHRLSGLAIADQLVELTACGPSPAASFPKPLEAGSKS